MNLSLHILIPKWAYVLQVMNLGFFFSGLDSKLILLAKVGLILITKWA